MLKTSDVAGDIVDVYGNQYRVAYNVDENSGEDKFTIEYEETKKYADNLSRKVNRLHWQKASIANK